MQLQVGDRLVDETGEWEVVGRPYTTAVGRAGGLLAYGWKDSDQFDRAARYVAKILHGANPRTCPSSSR